MKHPLFLIMVAFLLATVSGCKEIRKLTQFDLPLSQEFVLPPFPTVIEGHALPALPVQADFQETFGANGISKENIEVITLKQFTLIISAPENGDFSFLKSIDVYIKAEGLPKTRMAWKNDISAAAGTTLALELNTTQDLKEYIFKSGFDLEVVLGTKKITKESYSIGASILFHVDAKVLGL